MHTWTAGPFLGFDTETTGVDPHHDRIVTAALVRRDARGTRQRTWLIDPGVEIPAPASAIHGITTGRARAEGAAPADALEEIAAELVRAVKDGVPVVAYNACFDLTLLEHELARWALPTLAERLGGTPALVLDPLVMDRALDHERSGTRRLGDLCVHYRVEVPEDLHTAEVDVLATLGVLDSLLGSFPELGARELADLHEWQRGHHRDWASRVNARRAAEGLGGPDVDLEWLPTAEQAHVQPV
ncbi:exonuclease domain-containing protein [Georgenia satyanarayanai]|uniref:exonuclease domain-containing protein n=1 Tax=Georgenia satyanarayanai TaxID=860221 RepID=UPI0020416D38|nr:exonuclease domain-containing protein [Georgenia satyanarayanai]MCM3660757.1 exonuclease domain-containing protein [Georgenia satyanarayanai]